MRRFRRFITLMASSSLSSTKVWSKDPRRDGLACHAPISTLLLFEPWRLETRSSYAGLSSALMYGSLFLPAKRDPQHPLVFSSFARRSSVICANSGSRTRMNGFKRRSSPIGRGTVGSLLDRRFTAQLARVSTSMLPGSSHSANRTFSTVYSCPQNTSASSGSHASVWLMHLCMSFSPPWKNAPTPPMKRVSPEKIASTRSRVVPSSCWT
mmetsp:Transcript_9226/g.17269  ORF Transcript_9226/g.17269 Transcript_9226/m.17269 type:complete len:210 (+) Transcript_9226:635-1264(+)